MVEQKAVYLVDEMVELRAENLVVPKVGGMVL
jgi:hypothetical protein